MQSWNLNVQRQILSGLAVMAGYYGSKGTHLIFRRNINQPIGDLRPFPVVSPSSPILPGTPLGNITQVESTGNSSYNALWISAVRPVARGLQVNASYTWSKSIDENGGPRPTGGDPLQLKNMYNLMEGERAVLSAAP